MPDLGLTHVALTITDLEASLAFWGEYARMEVVHRREGVAWISDRTRAFVIVLIEFDAEDIHPLQADCHLGVACASRDEVDALCERARKEGVLIEGPSDMGPPVGYWAYLRDPDGHTLELSHGQEVGQHFDQG